MAGNRKIGYWRKFEEILAPRDTQLWRGVSALRAAMPAASALTCGLQGDSSNAPRHAKRTCNRDSMLAKSPESSGFRCLYRVKCPKVKTKASTSAHARYARVAERDGLCLNWRTIGALHCPQELPFYVLTIHAALIKREALKPPTELVRARERSRRDVRSF